MAGVTNISSEAEFKAWGVNPTTDGLLISDIVITSNLSTVQLSEKTFDGGGHTITFNPSYTPADKSFGGLFATTGTGAIIKNFLLISTQDTNTILNVRSGWILTSGQMIANISNIEIRANGPGVAATANTDDFIGGGFIGFNCGGTISNRLIINNCKFTGKIADISGGIVGHSASSRYVNISNCFIDITSAAPTSGGIAGGLSSANVFIDSCFARGLLTSYSGAICSPNSRSIVTNCYSTVTSSFSGSTTLYNSGIGGNNISNSFYIAENGITSTGIYGIGNSGNGGAITINTSAADRTPLNNGTIIGNINNISNYTATTGTTVVPIASWPTDKWEHINEEGWNKPPMIKAFLDTDNWTGYTNYDSAPNLVLPMPCLLKGTLIQTPEGEKPIEELSSGDIITTSRGTAIIKKIHHRNSFEEPYLIPKEYYGETPKRDLYISAHHAFLIDHVWYHPKCCGLFKSVNLGKIEYYHIETFDQYNDQLLAEGMIVESFTLAGYPYKCRGDVCLGSNPD